MYGTGSNTGLYFSFERLDDGVLVADGLCGSVWHSAYLCDDQKSGLRIQDTQGFTYEMLTEVIRLIREKYPTMDIVGLIEKDNIKSIGLFEKLGFQQECFAESIYSYVYVLYA